MPLIHRTPLFSIEAPTEPHVSRTDGGHMVIYPAQPVRNRWNFDPVRATALMRLSMLAGEAMYHAMNQRGVPVERINFQDNGNWAINSEHGPHFHLHLYGRARNSIHQVHGEALYFPPQASRFWEELEPLNNDDCLAIALHIERLAATAPYQPSCWGLRD